MIEYMLEDRSMGWTQQVWAKRLSLSATLDIFSPITSNRREGGNPPHVGFIPSCLCYSDVWKLLIIEKLVFQILNTYPFTSTIGSLFIDAIKSVTNNKE
jgi:hypothetical protein